MPTKISENTKIECKKYIPIAGKKRCVYYIDNGSCGRKDELLCSEWIRKNPSLQAEKTPKVDHVGSASPADSRTPVPVRRMVGLGFNDPGGDVSGSIVGASQLSQVTPLKNRLGPSWMSLVELEELISSGKEVNLDVSGIGSIWLVPAYTNSKRQELSYGDARCILAIKEVFPKSEIVEITKPQQRKQAL